MMNTIYSILGAILPFEAYQYNFMRNAFLAILLLTPLLGLLGTVVGMIQMFLGILDHGLGDVNQLAGGIGKALVCTATGMIVAVPSLMFHRFFRSRIAGYVIEMEEQATALLDALDRKLNATK